MNNNKLWFYGPEWLTTQEDWPQAANVVCNATGVVPVAIEDKNQPIFDVNRFSSMKKILSITSICYKWYNRYLLKNHPDKAYSNAAIQDKSLKYWISQIQQSEFPEESNYFEANPKRTDKIPSLVTDFNLFIDKEGLMRCQGRLGKSKLTYGGMIRLKISSPSS